MPKEIFREVLCCNYKKCPEVVLLDDGSLQISDDDADSGSTGTVKFKPEQVAALREILNSKTG